MSTLSKGQFYAVAFILSLVISIAFNYYLATGCEAGSGVITTHGKVCAFSK